MLLFTRVVLLWYTLFTTPQKHNSVILYPLPRCLSQCSRAWDVYALQESPLQCGNGLVSLTHDQNVLTATVAEGALTREVEQAREVDLAVSFQ